MRRNFVHTQFGNIFERRAQADGAGNVGSACLEFVGHHIVGGLFEGDGADHIAATLVRGHLREDFLFAVEHADARWPVDLVPGECVEIAADSLHVHRQMRNSLRAIHQHRHVVRMSKLNDFAQRVHRAQGIRHMGHGHDACARRQQLFECVELELAGVVDGRHAEVRAFFFTEHLPRDNVGVMLHGGDEHLVAFAHVGAAVCLGDEIDGLGCAANKDDFVGVGSLDKAPYRLPRLVVCLGGTYAQRMHTAMDVGIVVLVITHEGVDHRARLLRSGCAIQIDQLVAVDLLVKDGEIALDPFNIQRRRTKTGLMYRGAHPSSSQFCASSCVAAGAAACTALTSSCRRSRISFSANSRAAESFMRSRHSAAKA